MVLVVSAGLTAGRPHAADTAPTPAPGAAPAGKLDLRLNMPRATTGVEGDWLYQPIDGSEPYTITISATQGGFYEFEGKRPGVDRPVLQMDRGTERALYRGEVGDRFDTCIPPGARFSLYPTVDRLVFEPSMPMLASVSDLTPGACLASRTYVLSGKGSGNQIKLRTQTDIFGSTTPPSAAQPPDGKYPGHDQPSGSEKSTGASITIGQATAPDGAHVALLGSMRDAAGRLWHHVRLLDAPESAPESTDAGASGDSDAKSDGSPAQGSGKAAAAGASQTGTGPASGAKTSAGAAQTGTAAGAKSSSGGGASSESEGKTAPGRDDKAKPGAKPSEPASGYVPADDVIVRWQCRFDRVVHP